MHVTGLITEYNPFHNGHLYHIQKTREITGADYIIVVMSGNFVQRGAPAMIDKYTRTEMALKGGADLVIELPAAFAASSAENFAAAGIALLNGLGIVDSICFGSECGDVKLLKLIAKLLAKEPPALSDSIKAFLKEGLSYPEARANGILSYLGNKNSEKMTEILKSPNNILGIEYIKAIIKSQSSIRPYTIKRQGTGYHDVALTLEQNISSATAIRLALEKKDGIDRIQAYVPDFVFTELKSSPYITSNDFSSLLSYCLLSSSEDNLVHYSEVSKELASRIYKNRLQLDQFDEFTEHLKTKQYTYTRISRSLFHILLNIKKTDIENYKNNNYMNYARILGFRYRSKELLTALKKQSLLPMVTKIADVNYPLLNHEIFASHLYNSVVFHKYGTILKNEYTRGIIIL